MRTTDAASQNYATALPAGHFWPARPTSADLAGLPGCPAVFLLVDGAGRPVQLATTQALKRQLKARLLGAPRRGKADLAEVVRGVRWRPLAHPFEGRWWYFRLARQMYPDEYRKLVSFGPAHFLHVDWTQPIPELRVSERVWCLPGEFLGPWPSHKACRTALEGLWDLFDLCRYPEQVRRSPHGQRCAYAEMGRCDAPCDGGAPLSDYVARCRAAWRFARGGMGEWCSDASTRMRLAADEQKYELAGQLKQQLSFAQRWRAEWSALARPVEQLNYLIALPVTRRKAWKLMLFRHGYLEDGPVAGRRQLPREAPEWLARKLAATPEDSSPTLRMEQTWLLCHMLFSRESRTMLMLALPDLKTPCGLEETLADALEHVPRQRAAESAANDGTSERAKPEGDAETRQ